MEPTDATIDILKKIQTSIAQLRDRMDAGFTELRTRADAQGQQLQSQGQQLQSQGQQLQSQGQQLQSQGQQLQSQGQQLQSQGQRLSAIERRLGELVDVTTLSVTRHLDLTRRMDAIESRVDALEGR